VSFAGVLQTLKASEKLLRFSYKEEVAGSIGHRPLIKYLQITVTCGHDIGSGISSRPFCCNPSKLSLETTARIGWVAASFSETKVPASSKTR
jgi:hypothetical protein